MPLYGFALQCRITTEDPANNFVPDYGKIHTYRSPAGFGIRLDGGSAYSGAVITPYYDSLLVKTTAWGREFRHACQRMDRALREFRVRGVKTNIPFLENVVNHPDFQAGRVTTRMAGTNARTVPLRAAKRPRHQAAHLSGRGDRQPESDGRRKSSACADRYPRGSAAQRCGAARRHAANAGRDGPGKVRRMDPIAEAVAAHRYHVPRRAPIAAGHARPHV